jgi:hypothetical protein
MGPVATGVAGVKCEPKTCQVFLNENTELYIVGIKAIKARVHVHRPCKFPGGNTKRYESLDD